MTLRMIVASATGAALASAAAAGTTTFNFPLGGDQENPPTMTDAFGTGSLTFDTGTGMFDIDIFVENLTLGELLGVGPNSTPIHIHNAPAGSNGGIVIDLGLFSSFLNDGAGIRFTASDISIGAQEANLFGGLLYVNIHTTNFGGGEIRGQIVPAPAAASLIGLGGLAAVRRRR
ncbi:MAG: CHRD domain-containing protein [Phycisphaerales bacterium]